MKQEKEKKINKNNSDKKQKKDYRNEKNPFKKFWYFIWYDDSFLSYVLNFAFAFLFIKYLFFPVLGFALNNDFPIVAIVSGSMEHKVVNSYVCGKNLDIGNKNLNLNEWWNYCGNYYEKNYNLSLNDFSSFSYKNGLNIGDVMVLYGKKIENIEIGDVLVFEPQDKLENGKSLFFNTFGPVIHRVVAIHEENGQIYFQTKGDHNSDSVSEHKRSGFVNGIYQTYDFDDFETRIPQEDVIAVAVFRVPYIGYVKILLNDIYLGIRSIF